MDQEGQNGTGDGPQNNNADSVVITPVTHGKDEKADHCWYVLYERFQWF
jgi:hypothetical protein